MRAVRQSCAPTIACRLKPVCRLAARHGKPDLTCNRLYAGILDADCRGLSQSHVDDR